MIQAFVDRFMAAEAQLKAELAQERPESYDALAQRVVEVLAAGGEWDFEAPDPSRVTVIDHGHYQGTRLFVVGAGGYQPSRYWVIAVSYGSCSGCDAFLRNRGYGDDEITEQEVTGNWTMMLHMVQSMREISDGGL